MNINEAQRAFTDISRSTIYRWLNEGKLQRASLGKKSGKRSRVLIRTESVKKLLDESAE
jgi:predicted site-specific integrase-resolvase